jgi:hypothetical protein
MKTFVQSRTQRQSSVVAGVAIIIMTIAAVLANDVTIRSLIAENNAAETLKNFLASKRIVNIGVLSWLVILISDVFAAWGLYIFFRPVSKNISLIAAWFRLTYVAMLAVSILNLIYVQLIIHQLDTPSVDLAGQIGKSLMFYLSAFDAMWSAGLFVFGIHILLVGYLALKSEYVPKILGILLIIAFGGGYTIPKISNLLFPEYKDVMRIVEAIFFIPMLGEVALGVWLLIIGLRKGDNIKHNE